MRVQTCLNIQCFLGKNRVFACNETSSRTQQKVSAIHGRSCMCLMTKLVIMYFSLYLVFLVLNFETRVRWISSSMGRSSYNYIKVISYISYAKFFLICISTFFTSQVPLLFLNTFEGVENHPRARISHKECANGPRLRWLMKVWLKRVTGYGIIFRATFRAVLFLKRSSPITTWGRLIESRNWRGVSLWPSEIMVRGCTCGSWGVRNGGYRREAESCPCWKRGISSLGNILTTSKVSCFLQMNRLREDVAT